MRGLAAFAIEQVEHDFGAKASSGNTETGVAECVDNSAAHRSAEEHTKATARVDDAAPCMAELHALELRERSEEMLRQLGPGFGSALELRVDLAAPVIDHVVAAPQDSVVLGESVVVELVRDVAESLTVGPANVGQLCGCERLGDHAVVVDRNHVMVQPLEQWLERVCCKCNFASAHCAERGAHNDTHAVFVDRDRFGVFVNGDAK